MDARTVILGLTLATIYPLPTYAQQAEQARPSGDQDRLSFKDYHLNSLNLGTSGEPGKYSGNFSFAYQNGTNVAPAPLSSLVIPFQNKTFEEVSAMVRDPEHEIRKLFKEDDEFIKHFEERR